MPLFGGSSTISSPADTAFAKLSPGTVETLLRDPQGQLKQILLYHVVPGKYIAPDVVKEKSLMTVQGSPLEVTVNGSTVRVDGVAVIISEIETSNRAIHVIDSVMLTTLTNDNTDRFPGKKLRYDNQNISTFYCDKENFLPEASGEI